MQCSCLPKIFPLVYKLKFKTVVSVTAMPVMPNRADGTVDCPREPKDWKDWNPLLDLVESRVAKMHIKKPFECGALVTETLYRDSTGNSRRGSERKI